jgi:uncharacterized protein (TIGR04141 family)
MSDMKRVTLFRIKDGRSFEDFLKGSLATYTHIEQNDEFEGYIKYDPAGGGQKTEEQIPWLRFLNSGFAEKKYTYEAFNKYPRALMALRVIGKDAVDDVFYAAAFGQHGDSYLDKEQIVYDFGIKVGMNICDAEKLRRIQTAAHEAISRQTERQASTGASLGVFGINTESEFLRTISGHVKTEYKELVDSFRGKDSILIKFPKDQEVTWTYLAQLCRKLEERYGSDDYTKTDLKVYDILRYESDPVVIAELNRLLCAAIEAKNFNAIHLAPPDFLADDDSSFAYVEKDGDEEIETFDDLRIADLIAVKRRRLKDLDETRIKGWKIFEYNPELDRTFVRWDAYRCLVAEVEWNGRTFVLSSGQWREVSEELKASVEQYLDDHDLLLDPAYLPQVSTSTRPTGRRTARRFSTVVRRKIVRTSISSTRPSSRSPVSVDTKYVTCCMPIARSFTSNATPPARHRSATYSRKVGRFSGARSPGHNRKRCWEQSVAYRHLFVGCLRIFFASSSREHACALVHPAFPISLSDRSAEL